MGLAVVAFLIVSCTILGGYWAVTVLPGRIASRKMDARLRDVAGSSLLAEDLEETVIKRKPEGPIPPFDRLLAESKLQKLIEQSGVNTTPSGILLISVAAAGLLSLVSYLISGRAAVPMLVGTVSFMTPTLFLWRRRVLRFRKFEEQFPEALDLLSRAIRAGHAFQTAMGMVADELPPPVGPEFRKTFDRQNFGLPLREALNEMMERVALLDVKFFVTAVLIQRETGGNLAEILDNLAGVVRERFKILRQVRVHTAHGRFTGYVLLALPAALGVALVFINPDLMRLLFQERLGQMMLTGAMVLQTIGFFWIRHVIKIEV
jgi:tight adherence protein B